MKKKILPLGNITFDDINWNETPEEKYNSNFVSGYKEWLQKINEIENPLEKHYAFDFLSEPN